MEDFVILHTRQRQLYDLTPYTNEYDLMKKIQNSPGLTRVLAKELSLKFFKDRENYYIEDNDASKIHQSNIFRELGNILFTAKGKEKDLLGACRYYTKAIFVAPLHSEALALAHANRAMSLQKFGYFQEAYDDCVCAIEQGYPENLLHKLVTRQAFSALKLDDAVRLKQHLDTLDKLALNSNFTKQKHELHLGLQKLTLAQKPNQNENEDEIEHELPLVHEKINFINDPKDRVIIATKEIKKNELIFSERGLSFVPTNNCSICHYCAHTQFIPFPCYQCYGRVVYCSIKCRNKHSKVHEYECAGYRLRFFEKLCNTHLALRIVLENLPALIPELEKKRTAKEMWSELAENGSIYNNESMEYSKILRMVTHLSKTKINDIYCLALTAELIVYYLAEYTKYFDLFPTKKYSIRAWKILTGALILRHTGQIFVNSCISYSLTVRENIMQDPLDFSLTVDDTWAAPYRVKLGHLHHFSSCIEVARIKCQYFGNFKHACEDMFQPRYSGRYICGYAIGNIKANEKIFYSYVPGCRITKFQQRRKDLLEKFSITCECRKCERAAPDEEYEIFHRYRCENPNCGKEFVPNLPNSTTLSWWQTTENIQPIHCVFCGKKQKFPWIGNLCELLKDTQDPIDRLELYGIFTYLENWLLGHNELRAYFAIRIIQSCFTGHCGDALLRDIEFLTLGKILKYFLSVQATQFSTKTLEYVSKMTYLWDFIALGKLKCSREEMEQMLEAAEILSKEDKRIFINYYEDYIKDKLE